MKRTVCEPNRAFRASGFWTQCALMAIGLATIAWTGEALAWTGQALAYVSNNADNTISVIDTGDNAVVATIPGVSGGLAVTPDMKFVYVAGTNLSVIDAGTDQVAATIPGVDGSLAVTPDGKYVYVAGANLWVIDTGTNQVVATLPGGFNGFAIAPDGTRVYLTSSSSESSVTSTVSVIDTGSNTVVATVSVGPNPVGLAVGLDGKHAYVTFLDDGGDGGISVIDTQTNTVVETLSVGAHPSGVAVPPDGNQIYFTDSGFAAGSPSTCLPPVDAGFLAIDAMTYQEAGSISGPVSGFVVAPDGKRLYLIEGFCSNLGSVLVVDTASYTVVGAPIPVGQTPGGGVFAPDGKHIYILNTGWRQYPLGYPGPFDYPGSVSVIDATSNTVVTTIPVGQYAGSIAIIPPQPGVPFVSFTAKLDIQLSGAAHSDSFKLRSEFTLSSEASNGIHPDSEPVRLQVGPFVTTLPPGSFTQRADGGYSYKGVVDGVSLEARIEPTGSLRYALHAKATGASMAGTTNPVQASTSIGDEAGVTSITAHIGQSNVAAGD